MEGGINAWEGLVAKGTPQSGMAYFPPAARPEELMALAWFLEEGSRKFYAELAVTLMDREARDLYGQLSEAEEHHKAALLHLYNEIPDKTFGLEFPWGLISDGRQDDVMEGGMHVGEALQWAKGKKTTDVLELSLSLETNAYDLYLTMERRMGEKRAAQVFHVLAGEEKQHLERLSLLLEKKM
jgi:sulfur-carrier protein adenylyltransferase/sulfurtransferase